jgi:pachytene checkpoint protein 2
MSGRSLRRLPVLAHAQYGAEVHHFHWTKEGEIDDGTSSGADIELWLDAMEKVVEDQGIERVRME